MSGTLAANSICFQKRWRKQTTLGGQSFREGIVGLESWPGGVFNSFGLPFPNTLCGLVAESQPTPRGR